MQDAHHRDEALSRAAALLPAPYRAAVLAERTTHPVEEIRLRAGQAAALSTILGETPLSGLPPVTPPLLRQVLERATASSYHAAADSLRQGFLPAPGGCRIGVCGMAAMEHGEIVTMREVSSLAIRVARDHPGIALPILDRLCREGFRNTLLLSPPGVGKTTLLRDLIRGLSCRGYRVSVADERGEIAGMSGGMPGFSLGPRTDVLTGMPKAQAATLLLRAMTPQVIALDEISAPADIRAAEQIADCGTALLATMHAAAYGEAAARPLFAPLAARRLFPRVVVITVEDGVRRYRVEEAS